MYKYLFIFEDGEIKKGTNPTPADYQACDDGYLDIIKISNEPKQYLDGEWHDLPEIKSF